MMQPLNQYLLEEPDRLTKYKANLRINILWKTLAILVIATLALIFISVFTGILPIRKDVKSPTTSFPRVLQKEVPKVINTNENQQPDIKEKSNFEFLENSPEQIINIKIDRRLTEQLKKYEKKFDKLIPALKETSHENKFITSALLKKIRMKRHSEIDSLGADEINIDPLAMSGSDLRLKVRNKRAEEKLIDLENELRRCKKEAKDDEDCMPYYKEMKAYYEEIRKKLEEMEELFKKKVKPQTIVKKNETKISETVKTVINGSESESNKNNKTESRIISEPKVDATKFENFNEGAISNNQNNDGSKSNVKTQIQDRPMKFSLLEHLELTTVKESINLSELMNYFKGIPQSELKATTGANVETTQYLETSTLKPKISGGKITKTKCPHPTEQPKYVELPETIKARAHSLSHQDGTKADSERNLSDLPESDFQDLPIEAFKNAEKFHEDLLSDHTQSSHKTWNFENPYEYNDPRLGQKWFSQVYDSNISKDKKNLTEKITISANDLKHIEVMEFDINLRKIKNKTLIFVNDDKNFNSKNTTQNGENLDNKDLVVDNKTESNVNFDNDFNLNHSTENSIDLDKNLNFSNNTENEIDLDNKDFTVHNKTESGVNLDNDFTINNSTENTVNLDKVLNLNNTTENEIDLDSKDLTVNSNTENQRNMEFDSNLRELQNQLISFLDDKKEPNLNKETKHDAKIMEFDTNFRQLQNNSVTFVTDKGGLNKLNKKIIHPTTIQITTNNVTPRPIVTSTTARAQIGGGFPVTGETIKATAQFLVNPYHGIPSTPLCFSSNPGNFKSFYQPMIFPTPFQIPSPYGPIFNNVHPGAYYMMPQIQQSVPMHPHGVSASPFGGGTTAAANHNVHPFKQQPTIIQNPVQPQLYCTYMPNSGNSPSLFFTNNMGSFRSTAEKSHEDTAKNERKYSNIPENTDIVYASFVNQMLPLQPRSNSEKERQCDSESIACYSTHQCIPKSSWCDNKVDCTDASDESACSCKSRLYEKRICDGYPDCPMGEDEMGCFGCDKLMFSCYNSLQEYLDSGNSSMSMCYSSINKCDGYKNCLNGNDEKECNALLSDFGGNNLIQPKAFTEGFLHHNFKGRWYPVCGDRSVEWATEACENEMGKIFDSPTISHDEGVIPGPFAHKSLDNYQPLFTSTCEKNGKMIYSRVHCPQLKCGLTKYTDTSFTNNKRSVNDTRITDEIERAKRNDLLRIVGGEFCKPLKWPFIIGIYKNGKFHCGGVIYNSEWIITAAHCFVNQDRYHYEVEAGLLRRTSYSSHVQRTKVLYGIIYDKYEHKTMKHDLALLKLEKPLKYNRWVRPICLPDKGRSGLTDTDWLFGPKPGTTCTAVGWGAIHERGPGSDQLREVSIPIWKTCKTKEDNEVFNICAGDFEGGRDACQGDSGGPLFCRSETLENEWYLAGVVSHGKGCGRAGEPGIYTRVALYKDWIDKWVNEFYNMPLPQPPKMECPGYTCMWGGEKCVHSRRHCDRYVDCLGGEDEVGCDYPVDMVGSILNVTREPEFDIEESVAKINRDSNEDTNKTNFSTISGNTKIFDKGEFKDTSIDFPSTTPMNNLTSTSGETTEKQFLNLTTSQTPPTPHNIQVSTEASLTPQVIQISTQISHKTQDTQTTTESLPQFLNITRSHFLETTSATFIETSTEKGMSSTPQHPDNLTISDTTINGHITTSTESLKELSSTESVPLSSSTETLKITEKPKNTTSSNIQSDQPNKIFTVIKDINKLHGGVKPLKFGSEKFMCKRIPQLIDMSNRCDRISDCEDGSDEEDCSCRHYLTGPLSSLLCDGKPDCKDLSDEKNCVNCTIGEYLCPLSRSCIPISKRCDEKVDCEFKEDELDCFALTNGKDVTLDANRRPQLNSKGFFTRNKNGAWRIICSYETDFYRSSTNTAEDICKMLGFKGSKFYNVTDPYVNNGMLISSVEESRFRMNDGDSEISDDMIERVTQLEIISKAKDEISYKNIPPSYRIPRSVTSDNEVCKSLFIECFENSNSLKPILEVDKLNKIKNLSKNPTKILEPVINPYQKPFAMVKTNISTLIEIKKLIQKEKQHKNSTQQLEEIQNDSPLDEYQIYHYPWSVEIFANGEFQCNGILLDRHWVAVPAKCYLTWSLEKDWVVALLGGTKKQLGQKGPHEQIQRINCMKSIQSHVLLLHLENAVAFSRHVLPTYLPVKNDDEENKHYDECMSVTYDKRDRIRTFTVKESICKNNNTQDDVFDENVKPTLCLESISNNPYENKDFHICKPHHHHQNEDIQVISDHPLPYHHRHNHHHGVIMCQDEKKSGWYPVSFYSTETEEFCSNSSTNSSSFQISSPSSSTRSNNDNSIINLHLEIEALCPQAYNEIHKTIENPYCAVHYPIPVLDCSTGFRCPLGHCLPEENVCNSKLDCHDGSDEDAKLCHKRNENRCSPADIKCYNGKCVSKSKFCDHNNDCGDLTDEPAVCSCLTYLKATDPSKICDGVRNCLDKSDESPATCNCTENSYKCASSDECIPKDFVCDGEPDCPYGEDEDYCYGLEFPDAPQPISDGYGQLIQQSYGLWYTKCFPRNKPLPTAKEVSEICKKLGYHNQYREPTYRLIVDDFNDNDDQLNSSDYKKTLFRSTEYGLNITRVHIQINNGTVIVIDPGFTSSPVEGDDSDINSLPYFSKYIESTKPIIVNKFSPIRLNENLSIMMKPSRPIAHLVKWNDEDTKNCYRMEIKCE